MEQAYFLEGMTMKKNRYLLCLLVCGLLLYYALPRLNVFASGAEGLFSIMWLFLAVCVVAGNLSGVLFTEKRRPRKETKLSKRKKQKLYS